MSLLFVEEGREQKQGHGIALLNPLGTPDNSNIVVFHVHPDWALFKLPRFDKDG